MKYALQCDHEPCYDILMDILYESENLIQDDSDEMDYPFIVLTSDECDEWEKVKEAYEEWQERFSVAAYECTLKPRAPFQSMEDYEKEAKEFLK